jgi:CheY-like chemotaxis protein
MKSENCFGQRTIRGVGLIEEVSGRTAAHVVKQRPKEAEAASLKPARTVKASPPHWIIVDDHEERLSLIRAVAARFAGMVEIQCFNVPQDAVAAYQAEPEKYEFIVTDLEMPGVNDHVLRRRLRAFSPLLKVLYSIVGEIFSDEEAAQKGFCEMPRKSFPFAMLQPVLAPATLKYYQEFSGQDCGLRLVCANWGNESFK